jgi:hypothetical protein
MPAPPSRVPLTEPQREVFLASALSDEANCAFNESLTVRLRGPVRLDDLVFALDAILARHDALRSTISEDGDFLCIDPAFSGQTESALCWRVASRLTCITARCFVASASLRTPMTPFCS